MTARRMTRRRRGGESQLKTARKMLEGAPGAEEFLTVKGVGVSLHRTLPEYRAAQARQRELATLRAARPVSRSSSPIPQGGRKARRRVTRRR